jgi:hypothetical protein
MNNDFIDILNNNILDYNIQDYNIRDYNIFDDNVNQSEKIFDELLQIVNNNLQQYEEIRNSCDIIKEIYIELQEKQKIYTEHISFLENLQSEINKLFIEISKKNIN